MDGGQTAGTAAPVVFRAASANASGGGKLPAATTDLLLAELRHMSDFTQKLGGRLTPEE